MRQPIHIPLRPLNDGLARRQIDRQLRHLADGGFQSAIHAKLRHRMEPWLSDVSP